MSIWDICCWLLDRANMGQVNQPASQKNIRTDSVKDMWRELHEFAERNRPTLNTWNQTNFEQVLRACLPSSSRSLPPDIYRAVCRAERNQQPPDNCAEELITLKRNVASMMTCRQALKPKRGVRGQMYEQRILQHSGQRINGSVLLRLLEKLHAITNAWDQGTLENSKEMGPIARLYCDLFCLLIYKLGVILQVFLYAHPQLPKLRQTNFAQTPPHNQRKFLTTDRAVPYPTCALPPLLYPSHLSYNLPIPALAQQWH